MRRLTLSLAAVAILVTACSSGPSSSESSDTGDAPAELACTHFRNVASDYSKGLLTLQELRDKLKEVYNDAQVSDVPGVAEGAQAMVADVTAGDIDSLSSDVAAFGSACSAVGL